ncbi:DUF1992 domain-containing protein [Paenibacillus sp. BC26]|uniref:DnaJ family domain-containing protein n=1 Tax=Paenibacillus sp. BC26 TaxID=1881032 RepID=UPI0008E9AF7F|nr:DUF1992 domain-containing protein [Paenibacillus sp. BC26]SFT07365.1 protein of unknown function [Paenibacillus sp. BC26]
MGFWFRKSKKQSLSVDTPQADEKPNAKSESKVESAAETETERPESAVESRQFWNSGLSTQDWIGEMYKEQERKGAFDHLPGKGKPIEVPSGDITNSFLKEANFLPAWLMLQHEIRDQLQKLILSSDGGSSGSGSGSIETELSEINKKIMKYNNMVPSAILQKRRITKETMQQQLELWK